MALRTESIPAAHARAVQLTGELISAVRPDQLGDASPSAPGFDRLAAFLGRRP